MVGRWTLAGAVAVGLAAGRIAASEEPVSPQDIAAAVAFLASAEAAYITGQCLTVDGGMVM